MLKKSIHGFFNTDLDEVNSSKSHKLLTFSSLAIWRSIHGSHSRVFFNTLLHRPDARGRCERASGRADKGAMMF
jgi:hypothetical protein